MNEVAKTKNVVLCASGQDRTGTFILVFTQDFILNEYNKRGFRVPIVDILSDDPFPERSFNRSDVSALLGLVAHDAVMAGFLPGGSPGMKIVSNPGLFGKELEGQYYLDLADTNKSTPIPKLDKLREVIKESDAQKIKEQKQEPEQKQDPNKEDIDLFMRCVFEICKTYKSRAKSHEDELNALAEKIRKAEKPYNLEIFKDLVGSLKNIWDKRLREYGKKNKEFIYDTDYLVHVLNESQKEHSTLRQIGCLLNEYAEKFPRTLGEFHIKIKDLKRQSPDPKLQEQVKTLRVQIDECKRLQGKNKDFAENKRLDKIQRLLSRYAIYAPFTVYAQAINELNALWIECAKKVSPSDIMQPNRLKDPTPEGMCNALVAKLNRESDHPYERAIATILQNVYKEQGKGFQSILNPPVKSLKNTYKWPLPASVKRLVSSRGH